MPQTGFSFKDILQRFLNDGDIEMTFNEIEDFIKNFTDKWTEDLEKRIKVEAHRTGKMLFISEADYLTAIIKIFSKDLIQELKEPGAFDKKVKYADLGDIKE